MAAISTPAWQRAADRSRGLREAARRTSSLCLFAALPLLAVAAFAYAYHRTGALGFDYRGTLWEPGRDVLDGRSPYPATATEVAAGNPSVYPPFVIALFSPLSLLPLAIAEGIWVMALMLAVVASLLALGVRDWRCHTVALASAPAVTGALFGNLTILLVLGAALAWRYRERTWPLALAVAFVIAAKLFLAPLLIWLAVTRRLRAGALAAALAVAALVVPWAALGFDGLAGYPDLLARVSDYYGPRSESLVAAVAALGASETAARGIAVAVAVLALAGAGVAARRRDGDRRAFALVLAASIALSPVVWPSYFALLLVPIAVVQRRLGWLWLAFAALWIVEQLPTAEVSAACCRPTSTPPVVWDVLHTPPSPWVPLAYTLVAAVVVAAVVRARPTLPLLRSPRP